MAASNTKGMTTLLLARLVDAGKLAWDEPVVKAYPAFKLADPAITPQVLFKHLICACTGLPRQDLEFIFEFAGARPASTFTLLSEVKPTSKFGEVFQYSNLMASAAGYIVGHLYAPKLELGRAYDRAMQKLVFDPLQMRSTTFDMARALRSNHASPHGEDADGKLQVEPMDANYCIVPHRPAGGVWTSAHDFAKYVQLELSEGKLPNGKQLVSAKNLLARRAPQIPLGEDASYGMGLVVDRTWGVPVVHHGGALAGYHSDFYALPEQGVGVVLLTNGDPGLLMLRPLMRRLLEVLFDGRPEAEADVASQAARHKAELAKDRERLVIPPDSSAVSALATRYRSADLGELAVLKRNGQGLRLRRMANRRRLTEERRRDPVLHRHRGRVPGNRVRGRGAGRKAGAHHPRRAARVRLLRGRLVDAFTPLRAEQLPGQRKSPSARLGGANGVARVTTKRKNTSVESKFNAVPPALLTPLPASSRRLADPDG